MGEKAAGEEEGLDTRTAEPMPCLLLGGSVTHTAGCLHSVGTSGTSAGSAAPGRAGGTCLLKL